MLAGQTVVAIVQRGRQMRGGAQGFARAKAGAIDDQHPPAFAAQAQCRAQSGDARADDHDVLCFVDRAFEKPVRGNRVHRRPERLRACGTHGGFPAARMGLA